MGVQRTALTRAASALAVLALVSCSTGDDPFAGCVAHSVEEGVAQDRAEAACEEAVGRDGRPED